MPLRILIYWGLLVCLAVICIARWHRFSRADRWLAGLMIVTVFQEAVAYLLAVRYNDNVASYHIYSPIELSLTGLYLIESMPSFRRKKLAWVTVGTAVGCGIINTAFLQPFSAFNTYYLLFESTSIILLSLWSLYKVMLREDDRPLKRVHFWLLILLLCYWSATFMSWGVYNVMLASRPWLSHTIFTATLNVANLIFYLGVAWTFVRYNRLIPSGE